MGSDCSTCRHEDLRREATGDMPAGKISGGEVLNAEFGTQTDFEVSFVTSLKVLEGSRKSKTKLDSDAEDTEAGFQEAEEKAKREAEERAKQEEEERAKREAERANQQAEERAKQLEEEQAKRDAQEQEQKRSFARAMQEAKMQQEAEHRARQQARHQAKEKFEEEAKEAAAAKLRAEAARKAAQEAEVQAAEEKLRVAKQVKDLVAEGEKAIRKRNLDAAQETFKKVIELDEKTHHGWAGRGKVLMLQGSTKEALKCLDEAIRRDSTLMESRLDRANCKLTLGKLEGGIKDINEVLKMAPCDGKALWMRAQAKKKKGDTEGAEKDAQLARRMGFNRP